MAGAVLLLVIVVDKSVDGRKRPSGSED